MSKMNLLVNINAYSDNVSLNTPSLSNVKWNRNYQGIDISNAESKQLSLVPGESKSLFSGSVTLLADDTTTYDLDLKSGTTNTYVISHNSGTAPNFRTPRVSGADATTEVSVSKNANLLTFSSSAGTSFSLIANGVVVGDIVRIGVAFNSQNQGDYKILSRTATSFTIENELGIEENDIVLGSDFATDINIYTNAGVQVGDKLEIIAGFSSVSFGVYELTDVSHDYLEFISAQPLPTELAVSNDPDAFTIYNEAKQFLYMESDSELDVKINSASVTNKISPISLGTQTASGILMTSGLIKSLDITNSSSSNTANIFYITME